MVINSEYKKENKMWYIRGKIGGIVWIVTTFILADRINPGWAILMGLLAALCVMSFIRAFSKS